jgi:hypothetical protein
MFAGVGWSRTGYGSLASHLFWNLPDFLNLTSRSPKELKMFTRPFAMFRRSLLINNIQRKITLTPRLVVLLSALAIACTFSLLFDTNSSVATGQKFTPVVLQSIGEVFEARESIGSIDVSADGQTLYVVSQLTGEVETYRSAADGSLLPLKKFSAPLVKSQRGHSLKIEKGKITVFDPSGKTSGQFATYPDAAAVAFLNNEDIVVASTSKKSLLHVYNQRGELLRSFGAVKKFDKTNASQNRFLSRGEILVDEAGNIYYVYNYVPLVQKFSPEGNLLFEVEVKGEAIDLQQEVTKRFFNSKQREQVGGVGIINAASIERKTGHLWIAMNGSSTSGVVYEYDGRGQKLREYVLQVSSPDMPAWNVINVNDLAVTSSKLYALTSQQQIYSFNRRGDAQAKAQPPQAIRLPQFTTLLYAFAPPAISKPTALVQSCGTAQTWSNCSFNCPSAGTCTGTPPVPPANTSDGSSLDCKSALSGALGGAYTVISANCTQYSVGTPMHTRGGCRTDVTICRTGTNSNHNLTLDCVAQSCSGSGGGDDECEEDFSGQYGYAEGNDFCNCSDGMDNDLDGLEDFDDFGCVGSPILVDISGNGFNLTDGAAGVSFDLNGDGNVEQLGWTAANSDDAWLALDRNGNGTIDNGRELFGNFTPQPAPPAGEERNGFLALAVHDRKENGGNGDGVIDRRDSIYASLRLWQDANHNGVSESQEWHTLSALNVRRLHLNYKESKRTDANGNKFKYRAKVDDGKDSNVGRWAWDVFLVKAQ